jgi:hypothetical protein
MNTAIYGCVVGCHGDWLYYQGDYGELYKIKTDGSQKQLLIEQGAYWITVSNDWIYYSNKRDKFRLYRISHDGSSNNKLNDNMSFNLHTYGGYIWYSNIDNCRNICKMKPETSATENLKLPVGKFLISEDWIFYRNKKMNNALSKAKSDGSQSACLSTDAVGDLTVSGNLLYYINRSQGDTIYKVGTDGTGPVQLCADKASNLVLLSGWLFYCNGNYSNRIYALRADGSLKLKAYDSEATCLKRIGNRLFFSDVKKGKLAFVFSIIQSNENADCGSGNLQVVQEVTPLNYEMLV